MIFINSLLFFCYIFKKGNIKKNHVVYISIQFEPPPKHFDFTFKVNRHLVMKYDIISKISFAACILGPCRTWVPNS